MTDPLLGIDFDGPISYNPESDCVFFTSKATGRQTAWVARGFLDKTLREWPETVSAEQLKRIRQAIHDGPFRATESVREVVREVADSAVKSARDAGFTPELGLDLIVAEIAASADPFKTGGDWIARITDKITAAIREAGGDGDG